jgi:hypothetical protein
VKKLIGCLIVMTSLPAVFMVGCDKKAVTSPAAAATATPTITRTPTATRTFTWTRTITSTPTITPLITNTPTVTPTPQSSFIATVNLRSAASFAVLAGTTITNSGPSTLCGDLGVSPGSAVVGAPVLNCNGAYHVTDSAASQAQLDLTTAYNDAAGRTTPTLIAGNIGGQTLYPGLYKSTSSLEISSGDLTLDAQGYPAAIFIFQIASTLITTPGRQVILAGGAQAANIFWQVGSYCALDTTTVFKGTIMAYSEITMNTGATLEGRALSEIDQVTFLTNTISNP